MNFAPSSNRPEPRRGDVPPALITAASWSWRLLAVTAAAAVVVLLFWRLRAFAIPLFIAVLLATQLLPAARWLARFLPRWLAAFLTLIALVVVLGVLTVVIMGSLISELNEIGRLVSEAADEVSRWIAANSGSLKLEGGKVQQALDQVPKALDGAANVLFTGVLSGASLLVEVIAGSVLALAFLIYLLVDGEKVGEWLIGRFNAEHRPSARRMADSAWGALGNYVRGVSTVALFDAVLIGIGLFALGVPIPGALTVLVFLTAFVPIAGAWVSGAICVAVALAGNDLLTAGVVAVIILAVQEIESIVLDPIVYRERVNLHPLVTLAAVMAGGIVAGIIGALLAVPVVAVAWAVIGERDKIVAERAAAESPTGPELGGVSTRGERSGETAVN